MTRKHTARQQSLRREPGATRAARSSGVLTVHCLARLARTLGQLESQFEPRSPKDSE
jgi:hypothetical protein